MSQDGVGSSRQMLVVLATAEGWSSLTSLLQNIFADNSFQMTLRSLRAKAVCDLSVEDRSISLRHAALKEDMQQEDVSHTVRGGTDAFLLLLHGGFYSEKERRLVKILQAHFGAEALKHLVILSVEDGRVVDTLDDALVDLINVCDGRYCRITRSAAGGGLQALQEMVENVVADNHSAGYTEGTLARSRRRCTEDLAMNMLWRKLQEAQEKKQAFMEEVQKQEERRAREMEELRAKHQEERRKEAAEQKQHEAKRESLHEAVSSHRFLLQRKTPEDAETQKISVVLLGLTGSGKSSALNLILNQGGNRYWFQDLGQDPVQDPVPPTVTCERKEMSAGEKTLILVDTPELWDEDGVEDLDLVKDCLALAFPGPHVFLLVFQVGRFTRGESEILGHLQRVFGREAAERTMVLFVRFDGNHPQRINEYVSGSHPSLQDLVRRCGSRYFELNLSRSRSPLSYPQVKELLSGIYKLVASHGGRSFAVKRFSAPEIQKRNKVLAEKTGGALEGNYLLRDECNGH